MTDKLIEAVAHALLAHDCPWVDAWPTHAFRPEALAAEQGIAMRRARAAIAAIEASGHAIVPVEPTEEMIREGGPHATSLSCYGAMLAARPKVQT